jgi:hypothetical protein
VPFAAWQTGVCTGAPSHVLGTPNPPLPQTLPKPLPTLRMRSAPAVVTTRLQAYLGHSTARRGESEAGRKASTWAWGKEVAAAPPWIGFAPARAAGLVATELAAWV